MVVHYLLLMKTTSVLVLHTTGDGFHISPDIKPLPVRFTRSVLQFGRPLRRYRLASLFDRGPVRENNILICSKKERTDKYY